MAGKSTTVATVAWIASRQHGVVTRRQLLRAGLTRHQIDALIAHGVLIRAYNGVYRVGHTAWSPESSYLAAVYACGDDAALCGCPAAHIFGLLKGKPPVPEVLATTKRRVPGVRTRRIRLRPDERTVFRRIPVTTVPRTLVDLAAELTLDDLAVAFHEAGHRYQTTPRHIDSVLRGRRNVPGARNLRLVLGREALVTLSQLERAFIAFLRRHNLPLPRTNRKVGPHRVDCHWPEYGLTVELNSYRFHSSRRSWEDDYQREREARGRDEEFRRFTYHDVFVDQSYMLRELTKLLRQPAPRP